MDLTFLQPMVLIAERDVLSGHDLRTVMTHNGFNVAGPFGCSAEVLGWIERWTPDVAILDVLLDDGPTDVLAGVLRRRGVLVLVHDEIRRSLDHARWQSPIRKRRRYGA